MGFEPEIEPLDELRIEPPANLPSLEYDFSSMLNELYLLIHKLFVPL